MMVDEEGCSNCYKSTHCSSCTDVDMSEKREFFRGEIMFSIVMTQ